MAKRELEHTPIKLSDLVEAFEFVSISDLEEHQAYICRKTGQLVFVADGMDIAEELEFPDDPDMDSYAAVPHRRDLDLGRRLALSFVAEEIPDFYDEACDIFRRKGAYSRFKRLLLTNGVLDNWFEFETRATELALREWCDEVGLKLIEIEQPDHE